MLNKKQKQLSSNVGSSLAASIEPLAHQPNKARILFHMYLFGRFSSKLAQVVPLPYSSGRPTRYSDRFNDFSVTIPRIRKMSLSIIYFLARLGFDL